MYIIRRLYVMSLLISPVLSVMGCIDREDVIPREEVLASDASAFVTGQTIAIDGGTVMS